jgi:hypothetical protein
LAPSTNPSQTPSTQADVTVDAPTDMQRFFQTAIFQKLWPLLRPTLDRADLFRLARVNSEVGTVATKALYKETTLRISSDPKDLDIFSFGFPNTSRPGLSRREAFSYLKAIHLERPNLAAARGLLKIRFSQLKELVIGNQYLLDIILQSHAMTVKPPDLVYMRYDNQSTPLNFAEAQLISHLVSFASLVDLSVHTSTVGGTDSERPLGYFEAIAKRLGIKQEHVIAWSPGFEVIDWATILASPPFALVDCRWWISPDLGYKLSLDDVPPIDTLKLRIVSASTTFLGLSAKNLVIVLAIEALYQNEPYLWAPACLSSTTVVTLAIFRYILQSRLVNISSISVLLPNPPNSAMFGHIQALYPEMVEAMGGTESTVDRFLRIASASKIETICDLTKASYLITVSNILCDHHTNTSEEVADFSRITFGYQQEGPWRHSRIILDMDQVAAE